MTEIEENINKKNIINVSRNKPVAFVVGAAGFLGSHLVDSLLSSGITVVGTDEPESSGRKNLISASKSKEFHLIRGSEGKEIGLERLDYLFVIPEQGLNLGGVLKVFRESKCRLVLVSSIELYQKKSGELAWLGQMESDVAKAASDNKLNARILRLGPMYGPRMDFQSDDPVVKLIAQTLRGNLQKEVFLEFSSRALYIGDAVDLLVRTMLAGATAAKIFDGVLPVPLKVSEIKQVLLDPLWYEAKDFRFSELPPWPTPNLEKTIKFLHWKPRTGVIAALKETLSFLRDNEIVVPEMAEERAAEEKKPEASWDEEKKKSLEEFKQTAKEDVKKKTKSQRLPKISLPWGKIYLSAVLALVSFGLIWPALVVGWGVFVFRYQMGEGLKNLQAGNTQQSLADIEQAQAGAAELKSLFDSLEPIRRLGFFKEQFEAGDSVINLSLITASAAKSAATGTESLLGSIKAITGERSESPAEYFEEADVELKNAAQELSRASAILKSRPDLKSLPLLGARISNLDEKISYYSKLLNQAHSVSILLPKMVALEGRKDYLVLLQNNMELRPTGGFIGSFALVSFEGGKLKKLGVNDIYAIDGNLTLEVEPPKEIKEDLGQKRWFLRDSNWEPDFPTAARQAEWFYTKEVGNTVDGVVALDVSAVEELLRIIGPLDLPDYKETISAENLFQKAVSHAELSFFPGSQAKKSFLTALANSLFEKMFFLPQNNWSGIVAALGKSLDEKHLSIYLNDPTLLSYVLAQNWTGVLPRQSEQNSGRDFLSLVEANLGANKANFYLDRSLSLETVIGKDGEVRHALRINYINRSPSDAFPGGAYKNRLRIYLPFNSKLNRALWGETDVTTNVSSFVDYGRSGISLLLTLEPKEQKTLVLDYSVPVRVEFEDDRAAYRLDVIKQAGTMNDPLSWTVNYPIGFSLITDQTEPPLAQEYSIATDLAKDRSFLLEFTK